MATYNCALSHTGDTANKPPHQWLYADIKHHTAPQLWSNHRHRYSASNTLPIIAIAQKDTVADGLCMFANLNKSNTGRNVVWYLVFLSLHIPHRAAIQKVYIVDI